MTDRTKQNRPELLAPCGDMECLRAAINFGADAVYLAGAEFGMRTAPKNFADGFLGEAIRTAHEKSMRVYITCNTLPTNSEAKRIPDFIEKAAEAGADAFIVSDLGVLSAVKKYAPQCDIHISTQMGITNYAAANALYELGAKRVVLARELSLNDIIEIKNSVYDELEIECFVHGAICVSFSGRCLLSKYLTGRDANRGDCAQPCRWKYHLVEETRPHEYFPVDGVGDGTYIMNARDMCMIEHIPELIGAGIKSFKIEGRAKSAYYVSVIVNAYKNAIDEYMKNTTDNFILPDWIKDEVYKVSYREYCTGFYFSDPAETAEIYDEGGYVRSWNVMAVVTESDGEYITAEQRNRFFEGDELEVLCPNEKPFKIKADELYNLSGERIECTPHPKMMFKIKSLIKIPENAILRKEKS